MKIRDTLKKITLPCSQTLAFLYWVYGQEAEKPPLIIAAKTLSSLLLACYSYQKNPENTRLHTALVAHSVGDLLIALPIKNSMLLSMPAFFVGHLIYCMHLSTNLQSHSDISFKKYLWIMGFGIASALMTQHIAMQTNGTLSKAIPIYATGLAGMFVCANLQKEQAGRSTLSAAAYIISDIMIVLKKLLGNVPDYGGPWILYYLGQLNIVGCAPAAETQKSMHL